MQASTRLPLGDFLAEANRWEELWSSFLDWEWQVGAWDFFEDQVPLWEYVRVPVFLKLQELSGFMESLSPVPRPLIWRLADPGLLRGMFAANPYFAPSRPVVCLGIARRLWREFCWYDPYLDPFLDNLNGSYIYLERPEGGRHVQPTRTKHVYYTDLLAGLAACYRRTMWGISGRVERWLLGLESALQARFRMEVPIAELGRAYLAARRCLRGLYRNLLRRIRPRLGIIVAINPAERAFVEACRDLGIVTAEMQHGLIGPYDLTYTTPPGIRQKTYPDYALLFGPYWRKVMDLPVAQDNAVEVGFPFFQSLVQQSECPARQPSVLVLSQPGGGNALAQWAIRLARAAPRAFRVIFRPHPSEYFPPERQRDLLDHGIEIADVRTSIYDLQACSSIQVGVFSTALYEGLAFGLRTYIAPLPGYQYMHPMLKRGWMRLLQDESQPFTDRSPWPNYDMQELFLFDGTSAFHDWLRRVLSR
jgi:hypothetical protein